MLGVRRATSADVSAGYKNMDGSDTVNNGEWMYINATDSSGGSTDYTSCPFTNDGTNLKSQAKLLLDNKMPTTVYTVHFPDSRSSTKPWLGINGVFGSDTVAPTDTTENLWIARHQTVEQVKNGIANTQYIKRVMETGPLWVGVQFLWDPTKFPLWTW